MDHRSDPHLLNISEHQQMHSADSMVNSFLSDDYMGQDDLDGSVDNSDDSCNDGPSKRAPLREQDRFLPIANIAKIMKRAIPDNGKIAKDARECIQECVSEFISFVTSEASDRCHQEKRKTINGEDILFAMCTLGFDHYIEPLTTYLQKYRDTTKSDRNLVTSEVNNIRSNDSTTSVTAASASSSSSVAATTPLTSNYVDEVIGGSSSSTTTAPQQSQSTRTNASSTATSINFNQQQSNNNSSSNTSTTNTTSANQLNRSNGITLAAQTSAQGETILYYHQGGDQNQTFQL